MNLDLSKPVIWTSLGNINADELEHFVEWQKNGDSIVFVEVYKKGGVEVRRNAHAHIINGLSTLTETATL
jgi:hypothetical protein